jgi:hypothetical protein
MAYGDRKSQRVAFSKAIDAAVVSIDGTLDRPCMVRDISDSGAKIEFGDDVGGFDLAEFFLLLSTRGAVHRRCRVVRRYGNEIGVTFIRSDIKRR